MQRVASRVASFRQAIGFLTAIPLPGGTDTPVQHLARSLYLFPAVGLLIGLVSVASGFAAYWLVGEPVHAVVAIAASAVVTAGFHLDGLADTCDAVFSWRERERKLEIMKDSRIGAMGAIALIIVIALKVSALLALGEWWWAGAVISPVLGRWAGLYGIVCFPVAKNEGLASNVRVDVPGGQLAMGTLVALSIAAPLFYWGPWLTAIVCLAVAWGTVHLLASAMSRSLGGLTGDTYGALTEIGEVLALLSACVILT